MAKVYTLLSGFLFTIALGLSACRGSESQEKSAHAFTIHTVNVQPKGAGLTLRWTAAAGTSMYRVWLSRQADCSDRVAQMAIERTEAVFGALSPGEYFACVHAVPKYTQVIQTSCSSEYYDVDGAGYPADNQGRSFRVESEDNGTWKKFADSRRHASVASLKGGIILQSNSGIFVHDNEGKVLFEAPSMSSAVDYVWAQDRLFAIGREQGRVFLALRDVSTKSWTVQAEFAGPEFLAVAWEAPARLILLLRDDKVKAVNWYDFKPATANTPKLAGTISLANGPDDLTAFGAALYRDGKFILASSFGLYQLSPTSITTLLTQNINAITKVLVFPGTEQEFLFQSFDAYNLQPTPLICSTAYVRTVSWWSWNGKDALMKLLPKATGDYTLAGPQGFLRMNYRIGGSVLSRWNAGNETILASPPFTDGQMLEGDAALQGSALVNHGDEVWMYTPALNP